MLLTQKAPDAYHSNNWIFSYLMKLHLLNMNRNWTAIISIQIARTRMVFYTEQRLNFIKCIKHAVNFNK